MPNWYDSYLQGGRNPYGAAGFNINNNYTQSQALSSNSSGGDNGMGGNPVLNQPYQGPQGQYDPQGNRLINGQRHIQLGDFARPGMDLSTLVRDASQVSYDDATGITTPYSNFIYQPDDRLDRFMGYAVPALMTGAAMFGGAGPFNSGGYSSMGYPSYAQPGTFADLGALGGSGTGFTGGAGAVGGMGGGAGIADSMGGGAAGGAGNGGWMSNLTSPRGLMGLASMAGGLASGSQGGGMSGGNDFNQAAMDQYAANLAAARLSGRMNNPNVIGPYGSQTVTWNGDTPTINQTLSPEQQALYMQRMGNQQGLGSLASQGIMGLGRTMGQGLDLSSLGGMPGVLNQGGLPGIGSGEQTRNAVIQAMMSRADERLGGQRQQLDSDLIARGIRPGTEAYRRERELLNEAGNDAFQQAQIAGGNAAEQQFGMDAARRAQYAREQQQTYGQQTTNRGQMLSELMAQRNIPMQELVQLMQMSQNQNPFSMPGFAQNGQVAPAPVFGAYQAQNQYNTDQNNAATASRNAMTSGLFGLGASIFGGGWG